MWVRVQQETAAGEACGRLFVRFFLFIFPPAFFYAIWPCMFSVQCIISQTALTGLLQFGDCWPKTEALDQRGEPARRNVDVDKKAYRSERLRAFSADLLWQAWLNIMTRTPSVWDMRPAHQCRRLNLDIMEPQPQPCPSPPLHGHDRKYINMHTYTHCVFYVCVCMCMTFTVITKLIF